VASCDVLQGHHFFSRHLRHRNPVRFRCLEHLDTIRCPQFKDATPGAAFGSVGVSIPAPDAGRGDLTCSEPRLSSFHRRTEHGLRRFTTPPIGLVRCCLRSKRVPSPDPLPSRINAPIRRPRVPAVVRSDPRKSRIGSFSVTFEANRHAGTIVQWRLQKDLGTGFSEARRIGLPASSFRRSSNSLGKL
jgi:hypothetical protein